MVKKFCNTCISPITDLISGTSEHPLDKGKRISYLHDYIIDLLPVAVYSCIRQHLKRHFYQEDHRRHPRNFYITDMHVGATSHRIPFTVYVVDDCRSNTQALGKLLLKLQPEATLFGDAGYSSSSKILLKPTW